MASALSDIGPYPSQQNGRDVEVPAQASRTTQDGRVKKHTGRPPKSGSNSTMRKRFLLEAIEAEQRKRREGLSPVVPARIPMSCSDDILTGIDSDGMDLDRSDEQTDQKLPSATPLERVNSWGVGLPGETHAQLMRRVWKEANKKYKAYRDEKRRMEQETMLAAEDTRLPETDC
ncbi:hypothetical protein DOTSEDRAFT_18972 [Dothistroma septosporum NZE10]|uniref:Uncharacterized protein n=1 Tax=Dothistroma septosporum (strain NZE10 / CBS 128990) TaxID=675120 RepID=N1Q1C2_DOTSN|nr:hypothetical protein DOTSEDRAFT_18972 [Dothistroma septosporum NZE10]